MFGTLLPSQFIGKITTNLAITAEQATEIAKAVNEKVFLPIRESLKRIHAVGEAKPREAAPLEKKREVLQAIEAPESVPMQTRVYETTVETPPPAPPVTVVPTPTPEKVEAPLPAPIAEPSSTPVPPATSPFAEVPKKPAPQPAPRAAGVDPYRETAA